MAVCPFAVRKLIPPGSNDPRITATQAILHVAVSEGSSLFDFFAKRSGGIESHFYIRRDGTIEQYRDTAYEADANHTANKRAVSIETQGMGAGEWTPEQLASIKRLLIWLRDTHKIPLRRCPSHDQPGVGYHVMFGAPGPWTPVAKSCPGPDRIRQFDRVLVPWMNGELTKASPKPAPATIEETDDMDLNALFNHRIRPGLPRFGDMIVGTFKRSNYAMLHARNAEHGVGELAKLIKTMPGASDELRALADDIAAKVAGEVERLDAEAVADKLEINVKE